MARWKGLEPPAFWFVAKHSIQLSYQRICLCQSILSQTPAVVKFFFQKNTPRSKNPKRGRKNAGPRGGPPFASAKKSKPIDKAPVWC